MLLSSVSKTLELILVVTKVHQTPFGDVIGCNVRIAREHKTTPLCEGYSLRDFNIAHVALAPQVKFELLEGM